jgi:hypothetical protein
MDIGLNAPRVGDELMLCGFGMLGPTEQTPLAHYHPIVVSEDYTCNFASYRSEVSYCSNTSTAMSCPGDSGSPIVVKPTTGSRWVCVGLDSYGHAGACGERAPDTVISKVASMIDFIKANTPLVAPTFQTIDYDLLKFGPTIAPPTVPGQTTTPAPSYDCWTCPPGFSHWYDFGYVAPPNGDKCQCLEGTPAPTASRSIVSSAPNVAAGFISIVAASAAIFAL